MFTKSYRLAIGDKDETSVLVDCAKGQEVESPVLILSHGAGAGIEHSFFKKIVPLVIEMGVSVVRFNFLYMERKSKRPDSKLTCFRVIEEVISFCNSEFPKSKIILGGKSFGGRMSSLYIATKTDAFLEGLVFLGFPLHNVNKVDRSRAEHLKDVNCRSLFLQGTRDKLADISLMTQVVSELPLAKLVVVDGADHSFEVLKRSGINQDQVYLSMAKEITEFINSQKL